jgi:hypothetical protein
MAATQIGARSRLQPRAAVSASLDDLAQAAPARLHLALLGRDDRVGHPWRRVESRDCERFPAASDVTGIAGLHLDPRARRAYAASQLMLYGARSSSSPGCGHPLPILFVVQTVYALGRKLVTPLLGVSLLRVYNFVIAVVAVTQLIITRGHSPAQTSRWRAQRRTRRACSALSSGSRRCGIRHIQVPLSRRPPQRAGGFTRLARARSCGAAIAA